jgi:hypothetical protein
LISDDKLVLAFLLAARQADAERPRIGVTNAHEWATTGRLAMRLSRLPEITALEKEGIFLDIEYGQMSAGEMKNIGDGDVRIDMILHRRGTNDANLLAVEVKMSPAKPRKVDDKDDHKLKMLTTKFKYKNGVWIRFPRSEADRNKGWYALYRGGERSDLQSLH